QRAAQCRATAPSAWGALTSAFFWISARTASRFFCMAASATSLPAAHRPADESNAAETTWMISLRGIVAFSPKNCLRERQRSGAVADLVLLDAEHLQSGQQQVGRGAGGLYVASALVLAVRA